MQYDGNDKWGTVMIRSSIAAAAMAGVLLGSASDLAKAETLTYGSPAPEQALFNREGVIPFLEGIEEVTDGRVSFRGLFGGAVVQMNTVLPSVRDGIVDSGFVVLGFYPSELPVASLVTELTGLGVDPVATIGALNEAFFVGCPQCLEDMKREGQIPLFLNATSPLTMQCTSAVAGAADLSGKRVSVIAGPEARWATALGMNPVRTAITDLLVSLQTGKTDCALVPLSWAQSYGLLDVVKGVINAPQGIAGGAIPVSVSLSAWREISEEDRKSIIDLAAGSVIEYVQKAYIEADNAVRPKLEGVAALSPGDDSMHFQWAEYQKREVAALAELARSRGVDNPQAFAENWAEIYRKWHEEYLPRIQADPDELAKILIENVYSKIDLQ